MTAPAGERAGQPGATEASPGAPAPASSASRLLRSRTVRWVALAALILLDLATPVARARDASLVAPTFHLDGSFQTASGLFRLESGELPGRDFFPYLGIGPVALLYPVFRILGGSLGASVFSSHLTTLLAVQVVCGVLAALVFGRRSPWVFAWAAAVPIVVLAAGAWWQRLSTVDSVCGGCLGLVSTAADPGNSLRPIRALAPYLLAGLAYLILRSRWPTRWSLAVVGVLAGAFAAVWSNDYGVAAGGLLLLVLSFHLLRRREPGWPVALVVSWLAGVVGYLAAGFGATGGHFAAYLSYNFSDVRGDQVWYFGALGRSSMVFSAGDLLRDMVSEHATLALAVLLAVAAFAVVRRDLGWLLVAYLGLTTLAAGLTATLGGHIGGYFWAFALWGYLVLAALIVRLAAATIARWGHGDAVALRRRIGIALRAVLATALVVALVAADETAVRDARAAGHELVADPGFTYEPRLGAYLGNPWEQHVDLFRQRKAGVVEEYLGLASAFVRASNGTPVDSVIAALGAQRELFAKRMAARPDIVVSSAPGMGPHVSWSISANWWFYRTLFQSYAPRQTSPTTVVWTPTATASWSSVPCVVRGGTPVLLAPAPGLYEVTLHYRGPGHGSREYSMVKNGIDQLGDGFVPLDTGASSQQLPVAVRAATSGGTELPVQDVSAGRGRLTRFLSCTASSIAVPSGAGTMELFPFLR